MTQEELRKVMQEGLEKLRPRIIDNTNMLMDIYQQGFKDCWKLLTGNEF